MSAHAWRDGRAPPSGRVAAAREEGDVSLTGKNGRGLPKPFLQDFVLFFFRERRARRREAAARAGFTCLAECCKSAGGSRHAEVFNVLIYYRIINILFNLLIYERLLIYFPRSTITFPQKPVFSVIGMAAPAAKRKEQVQTKQRFFFFFFSE